MVVDVEVNELGAFGEHRRLPEVEPEIEERADDEDEVGFTQGLASRSWKEQRVPGRKHAACHAVDVQRQVRDLHQPFQLLLGVRPPHPASRNYGGAVRFADEPGDLLDGVGIRWRPKVGREVLGRLGDVGGAEEHIERNVHEHRAGAPAHRGAYELSRSPVGVLSGAERQRLLREAANDLDVVHLLQRAHAPARFRRSAADDEHRAVRRLRLRDRRHRVGDPRPGGDRSDAALARHLGPALRGECRGLFVPRIDDPDPVLRGADEHRPDMGAVEGEQVADPGALQRQRNQLAGICGVAH